MTWQMVALFVVVDALWCWMAGYALAAENVVAGSRERFENWAYQVADQVRSADPEDELETDQPWDRAQPWGLSRRPPSGARRWTYRGQPGFVDVGGQGRKVPHRVRGGMLVYGVPTLDGVPLNRRDRLATVLRMKAADWWGCPKCSGWLGGLVLALTASHWGPWRYGWGLVVVLHCAGWGLARRVEWSQ